VPGVGNDNLPVRFGTSALRLAGGTMHNRCLADTRTALPTALGLALLLAPACGGGAPLHVRDGAVDASPADGPANADAPAAGNSQPDAASPADGGAETAGREPLRHRPAGASCPLERGPGWLPPAAAVIPMAAARV